MSTYDISKKIGHAQQTVSRYLKKYQIPMRVYTPKLTTLPLEKIKQLYFEQKLDSRSIGEIVGCSAPTICEILKRNKYLMRDPSEIGGCGLNRKVEQELLKFNYQFETNCRSQIHSPITTMPLELDFYFPTQKLAIEVNGDY
ncbi:hypothetical protein FACS1894166_11350 [Bacilli bacterium]|nr:hypothetical protein FACS1894166_11350 [Bacilli bacterium]